MQLLEAPQFSFRNRRGDPASLLLFFDFATPFTLPFAYENPPFSLPSLHKHEKNLLVVNGLPAVRGNCSGGEGGRARGEVSELVCLLVFTFCSSQRTRFN